MGPIAVDRPRSFDLSCCSELRGDLPRSLKRGQQVSKGNGSHLALIAGVGEEHFDALQRRKAYRREDERYASYIGPSSGCTANFLAGLSKRSACESLGSKKRVAAGGKKLLVIVR